MKSGMKTHFRGRECLSHYDKELSQQILFFLLQNNVHWWIVGLIWFSRVLTIQHVLSLKASIRTTCVSRRSYLRGIVGRFCSTRNRFTTSQPNSGKKRSFFCVCVLSVSMEAELLFHQHGSLGSWPLTLSDLSDCIRKHWRLSLSFHAPSFITALSVAVMGVWGKSEQIEWFLH